jgi:hypothetical protein
VNLFQVSVNVVSVRRLWLLSFCLSVAVALVVCLQAVVVVLVE